MGRPVPSSAGQSLIDLLAGYEQLVGKEIVRRALDTLEDGERDALETMTPVSWIPIATVSRFVDAVGLAAGQDPDSLLERAVRIATERTVKTVWRVLLRFTSDDALLARTPVFYAKSRNVGRLEASKPTPGRGELRLRDWPDVTDRHLRTLAASVRIILELAGRESVRVTFSRTPDGADFVVTFRH